MRMCPRCGNTNVNERWECNNSQCERNIFKTANIPLKEPFKKKYYYCINSKTLVTQEVKKIEIDVEMTAHNRADNQGCCPNCDERSKDRFFYHPLVDADSFLGYYIPMFESQLKGDESHSLRTVFKCRNCQEIFWCHNSMIMITTHPEDIEVRL